MFDSNSAPMRLFRIWLEKQLSGRDLLMWASYHLSKRFSILSTLWVSWLGENKGEKMSKEKQTQNSDRRPTISEDEIGRTRGKCKCTMFEIYTQKSHFL